VLTSRARAERIAVIERTPSGDRQAIVRRGEEETFRFLREQLGPGGLTQVLWDRRQRERRATRQTVLPERRSQERRVPPPDTWLTLGFLVASSAGAANGNGNGHGPGAGAAARLTIPGEALRPPAPARSPTRTPGSAEPPAAPVPGAPHRLGGVVALMRVRGEVYPSYYDPEAGGWRCAACDQILAAPRPGREAPRRGDRCPTCQAEVVRVLRWRWQQVNWIGLAAVSVVALAATRILWPLLP
jgi:hypothetical protein